MGVRTDGFEEAIMELMSAMEVNVEDDLEVLLQRNSSEPEGWELQKKNKQQWESETRIMNLKLL